MVISKIKLILLLNMLSCVNSISINTTYGTVFGIVKPAYPSIEQFLGIPYAKPPERWENPVPVFPWQTLNASSFGSRCTQDDGQFGWVGDEDCLYLNIYRPTGNKNGIPVMIYIHGGSWLRGAGSDYDPSLLVKKGIIVVTINYRLGFFGFATTTDSQLPGNYGLFDQHEAIAFTKKIIHSFGGDPQNITIFGESAGAQSVVMQLLSPLSKGLVQRGISQSAPFGFAEQTASISTLQSVCNNISQCTPFTTLKSIGVLQDAPISALRLALMINGAPFLNMPPSAHDGVFFPSDARHIVASQNISCYDFIGGWNNRDGNMFASFVSGLNNNLNESALTISGFGQFLAGLPMNQRQTEMVHSYYSSQMDAGRWINMATDLMFSLPTLSLLDAFVASGCQNTYAYRFSKNTPAHIFPVISPGAGHADDLQYFFDFGTWSLFSPKDQEIQSMLLTHWSQFAKGVPLQSWPSYGSQRHIIDFNNSTTTMVDYNARAFWSDLSKITMFPTSSPTSSPTSPPTSSPTPMSDGMGTHSMFILYIVLILVMLNSC